MFPLAALVMLMVYVHVGRLEVIDAIVEAMEPGPALDAMRYSLGGLDYEHAPPRPDLSGGPLDAVILSSDYVCGRVGRVVEERTSGWVEAVAQPWRIGALSVVGRTEQALELYQQVRAHGAGTAWLESYFGPQILIDAGRRDEAREALDRGRELARQTGSQVLLCSNLLEEARYALRLERDPEAALETLERMEREPGARTFPVMSEQLDMWAGFALLLRSEDESALERLQAAVESMRGGDRVLELPTAAVYLAEAHWRAGNEEAADQAADLALEASRIQGSNHLLLLALADFPAVVSRRLDAEPAADSPWHELGRALLAQAVPVGAELRATVELCEFGRCAIFVGAEQVRPRIAKSCELLAYLTSTKPPEAGRDELLDAMFDGRNDDSTRSYLRQAIRWLRQVLPGDDALVVDNGRVRLAEVVVRSESVSFETGLAQAARLLGEERLSATLEALELYDKGEYMPNTHSPWADERRQRLADMAADARYEAAELAYSLGRYQEADELVERLLRADPYRETAWRLTMRILSALGNEDGVIRAYQSCERALAEIGATPAPTTRRLLERLRR
jgi:DNA-binding SARP family transcriptional activator